MDLRPFTRRIVTTAVATVVTGTAVATAWLPGGATEATAAPQASTPNVAKLAGALAQQKLTWGDCDYGDAATNEALAQPNVQCTSVVVPQDWKNPGNGETWSIRVSQASNIAPTDPRHKGVIFVNPGGPGGSGLPWAAAMQMRTPDLQPYYNYVGFDPRGVGQSGAAECTYTESDDEIETLESIGQNCASDADVRTITTEQTTYDMDFIRHLLKEPKLSYIGYSYGTWLGAWYGKVFGANADKLLLDSSIDSTQATLQKTWDLQPIARDRQFREHLMRYIARQDDTYGLGTDGGAIYQRYFAATKDLDPYTVVLMWALGGGLGAFPDNSQYPAAASVVQLLIEIGEEPAAAAGASDNPAATLDAQLARHQAAGSLSADQTRVLEQARDGLSELKTLPTVSETPAAEATYSDPFEMIRCSDGQWTQGENYWNGWATRTAKKAPLTAQLGGVGVPVCAFWRTQNLMPVARADFPESIVLQSELDSQTGYEGGLAAGTKLPNAAFIAVDNEGSHGLFPYGTECVDRPIYRYFLDGRMPKQDVSVCGALPLPGETETFESWGKLKKNGKPGPGPLMPQTTTMRSGADISGRLLSEAAVAPQVTAAVRAVYGERGVEVVSR